MALHHLKLKAAKEKYTPLIEGKTKAEAIEIIAADAKGFSQEEAEEIYTAIGGLDSDQPKATHYQEWECKISVQNVDGKNTPVAEKLKKLRDVVKISDVEADVLNEGVLNGGNNYGKMYFKPQA